MLESIGSSKLAPDEATISGEFDSRKDSQPAKLAQRTKIMVKLSFRELCESNLSVSLTFDNITISQS